MKKIIVLLSFVCATIAFAAGDGFLSGDKLPNGLAILPPPPETPNEPASKVPVPVSNLLPSFAEDQNISNQIFVESRFFNAKEISKERYSQAINDANTDPDNFINIFIDALPLDSNISEEKKEQLKQLLKSHSDFFQKVIHDRKNSTTEAKDHYQRQRPYVYYSKNVCTHSDSDPSSDPDPHHSYPSAHSTRGMVVAYTIADLLPNYREQILARGVDYGDSRVICGAHWRSDVQAGRVMGNVVYSALKQNSDFKANFDAIKQQVDALI